MAIDDALAQVDHLVDAFVAKEPVPGVAYGVIVGGELVHTRGVGTAVVGQDAPPTAETVFRIASMTKSFTAATVLLLRDDGHLSLDDAAEDHVPELQGQRPSHPGAPAITLRHLLSMSAGFPGDDPWGDRQQDLDLKRFTAFLERGQSFAWMPGTEFEYSNLGYAILGRAITNVAGQEYRDVVRSRLLEPMGMGSTVYDASEAPAERLAIGYVRRDDAFVEEPFAGYGAFASMGGLFSSVRDLARWVDGFARAFSASAEADDHPLSRASRLEMQQAHRSIAPELTWTSIAEPPTAVVTGYGFGTYVRSDLEMGTVVGHSGGYPGFGSHMRWHPASGLGVVVLGNRTYFPALKIGEQMLSALVRAEAAPIRRLRSAPALDAARDAVERLLASWDSDLAAATFSMNVDMDEPIEHRRAAIERLRKTHGALRRSDEAPVSDTPFHAAWWLEGRPGRGRVKVEITLDPQPEPKVQWLELTSVPEPDPRWRGAAEALVASTNGETIELPMGEALDGAAVERDLLVVRALFGAVRLSAPIASGTSNVTYRVLAERGALDLALTMDTDDRMTAATWTPCTVRPPLTDVR
ncbi:MAG: serine hydrolase domain-containing protein [Actinomycetota bacterium]